jgi:flagellar hook-associated protein FlgK
MSSSSAIALSGMSAARAGLQASAHNIANLGTGGFRRQQVAQGTAPAGGVSVSLSQAAESGNLPETDMVGLLQAKHSFLANLAVFRAGDRMMGSLLDVVG